MSRIPLQAYQPNHAHNALEKLKIYTAEKLSKQNDCIDSKLRMRILIAVFNKHMRDNPNWSQDELIQKKEELRMQIMNMPADLIIRKY